MTSRIACIAINVIDAELVADFWCAVLGWRRAEGGEDDDEVISIRGDDDSWPGMDLLRVPDRKRGFNRLHLDLRADGSSFDDELERLLSLGATHADVGQPADVTWVVLADPEGNEFCLLRGTVQEEVS
jgi:catechol 2,3-dioxygenase-like lactoylglutathione lyase family enzyme